MRARVLPPDEWPRLEATPELPAILPYMDPEQVDVIVVEDGERIVASWSVMRVTHLEGLWIDPEYRNAGVVRRLLRAAKETARKWTGGWVMTGANTDNVRDMIGRLGGVKLPMDSYVLALERR